MTRSKREQLIERYLREDMTPAEEHDFFIEAATDKELRLDLKASRIMENAFRKDRETAPATYGEIRIHLTGLLAAGHGGHNAAREESPGTEQPTTPPKRDGRTSPGWIITAASIGLVSIISLMIGIIAINGEKKEPTATPARIEWNSRPTERPTPQYSVPDGADNRNPETESATLERNAALPNDTERSVPPSAKKKENASAANGIENPQEVVRTSSLQTSGKDPDADFSDTTRPNMNGGLKVETPRQ